MATISLYASKINNMPSLINDVKKAVTDYKSELATLKNKALKVNTSVCDLSDVVSEISSSTKTQDEKIASLEALQKNSEQFVSDTVKIDNEVADLINKRKDEFYNAYIYLRPECEKNGWEKFCDGVKSVGEWCKEHWDSICKVALMAVAIVAVVATIALCVVSFGGMAVFLTGIVGAVVGVIGQLLSDIVSFSFTGKWNGTFQTYVGAFFGGAVGGILTLTEHPLLACAAGEALSTLLGESLENFTNGEKRSSKKILLDTLVSAGVSFATYKVFGNLSNKFSKTLSENFSGFSRLLGRSSYGASYEMVVTKLKDRTIKNFTYKSVRNGIIDGTFGDIVDDVAGGLVDVVKNRFKKIKEYQNVRWRKNNGAAIVPIRNIELLNINKIRKVVQLQNAKIKKRLYG